MTRGEKIKLLMVKHEMSVKELATQIDIADSYLYKIINDKIKNPDPKIFNSMARALNCSIEDILVNDIDEERIYYDDENIMKHLPKDLQEFVLNEESTPYITVAKMLEGYNLDKITPFQMNVLIDWLRNAIKE